MSCTHRYQPLRRLPLGRRYALRQPLVGWRRCAKNMHDAKGLVDTRIKAFGKPACACFNCHVVLKGILSEASSEATNVEKTQGEEHQKIVFLQAK